MEFSLRTLWPLAAAGLLVVVVGAATIGAQRLESRELPARAAPEPPPAVTALAASATLTPTPRVIAIPGATATPAPLPTGTAEPTTAVAPTTAATREPPQAVLATAWQTPAPTPWVLVAEESAATRPPTPPTAGPLPTVAVVAIATATAIPEPTPVPTEVPAPTAPAAAVAVMQEFGAEDWSGGYYRGDGRAYGRPWVAVYGAFSDYPRAALTFSLDGDPVGPATLIIAGLDDEWDALNAIVLEVNGQAVYNGASPFANWDGVGDGADAAWTRVAVPLPTGLLQAGANEVAVANLTQSGNFDVPPYVLLADATLQVEMQHAGAVAPRTSGERDLSENDGEQRASRGEKTREDGEGQGGKKDKVKAKDKSKSKNKKPKKGAKHDR